MTVRLRLRAAVARVRARRAAWLERHRAAIERQEPWWHLLSLGPFIYMLVAMPPILLLGIIRLGDIRGHGVDAVLFLNPALIGAIVALMVGQVAVAARLAGYARMVTRRLDRRRGVLLVAISGAGGIVTIQQVAAQLMTAIDMTKGDQLWIVAYVTTWLLVVAYVCQVPLDRASDLWAQHDEERRLAAARRRWPAKAAPRRWRVRERRSRRGWRPKPRGDL